MYAQFGNLSADVPENIKEDGFSILYSIINNKQITIYNFDDKHSTYVIPFKSNLTIINKDIGLNFFTQLDLHNDDEKMDYNSTKTCDGLIYSIINKDDDILKLNTDLFKYDYNMLQFFKKTYSDCGFLFVKTTKKNVEFIFSQDLNNDKLFIPFVSLLELNKSNIFNKTTLDGEIKLKLNSPSLLYNAQGELVKMSESTNSSVIFNQYDLSRFIDYTLKDADEIELDGVMIGFYGLDDERISHFTELIKDKKELIKEEYIYNEKIDFSNYHSYNIYFKCNCKVCDCDPTKKCTQNKCNVTNKSNINKCKLYECKQTKLDFDFLKSIKSEEEFNNKKEEIQTCLKNNGVSNNNGLFEITDYTSLLKVIYIFQKKYNSKKKEEYNKPIKSNFDVENYLKTKYNITITTNGIRQKFMNLFKSNNENFVYFNIRDIQLKPEDMIL